MSLKKKLLFYIIKVDRYILKRKFIRIFGGPLKGYLWSTAYNYDYLTGDYEDKETMNLFCSWLKPDAVLYDLGANVGYYSFIANKYISTGNIYSFEPMPVNIRVFKEHLRLNNNLIRNKSIELFPNAVSDTEKEVVFSNNDNSAEGNTYLDSAMHKDSAKDLRVKCFSIDGLLLRGYRRPDILKIDVEGAELDVLKGADQTLRKYKPKILLATHDCHIPGVKQLCVDYLKNLGYELTALDSSHKAFAGLDDFIAIHKESSAN